ncbi:rod shape-determining protein MreD [Nocardioides montaniterrae]
MTAVLVVVALLLQVTVLPELGWPRAGYGAVPGAVLLVVVGTALATDTRFATLTGFFAGLLLDVAPPADHVAGRWALALTAVGYVVGRVSHDNQADLGRPRSGLGVVVVSVLGGSFLGNSVFALTGLVLHDLGLSVHEVLQVIGVGLVWDLVGAALVVPVVLRAHRGSGRSPLRPRARLGLR